ncbi:flagellar hook-basal body complex protein FliE [Desulfovibrio litoralis]|uniref:Flagellar hook-basal body complex protein FliE n=1 Tax=Desulfovibrio litoralis DSM 11393 TaxID=1121455 RepID=A0A1M7SE36_9BACT|nr:flagellar hook-basal body complex protein FliE [Desulfovibrio litoralis]SHN56532.1 flagellar hook-basal body complex protein FliE [Desulfovibrio litoralis DSM 11393]
MGFNNNTQNTALKAYSEAQANFDRADRSNRSQMLQTKTIPVNSFEETFKSSLNTVNNMQREKNTMIEAFASGEQQNVHELMIALQKAGLAMNMTTAVRNKLMDAYRELSKVQF